MMLATAQLTDSLQKLIDGRLDTIDRMLLGRLSRQDRLAIVREVESQIHELLQASEGEELTREDVLAALARLDPPEAYLPDDLGGEPVSIPRPIPARPTGAERTREMSVARAGAILGVAAIALLLLLPVSFVIAEFSGSELVLVVLGGGTLFLMFVASTLAVALGTHARKSGPWALVGIVTGLLGLFLSFATTTLIGAIFLASR
jgi:hypothetical protein